MHGSSTQSLSFLQGGGELGELIRTKDWAATPLGPPDTWPQSLKTTLGILLNSRYPMFLFWGPELVKIYNDGYRPITGHKHPWALGRPGPEVWPEIWHNIEPLVTRALGGDPTWSDDLLLFMERRGFPEEVYFTFSYSPIPDETGGIGGMFCACTETTAEVLGERRLRVLRDLAAAPADARDVVTACGLSADVLGTDPADVPFALVYLLDDDGGSSLVAQSGVERGVPAAPVRQQSRGGGPWPVTDVAATREPRLVTDLATALPRLPPGPWPEPPTSAMVLPLIDRGLDRGMGALVLGISSRRPFDDEYREWFGLVAGQISASISNARAAQEERRRAEALAEIDRAKTAFFSNVSHEFRTPLTLMLGPTEDALASDGVLRGEALQTLYRNELRLLKLVNALLDFSRIEAGRMRASYEPTALAELTADLASHFRAAFERAGLAYTVACDPIGEPVYVDRDMWEKIVLNLLSNALKFTFQGGVTVRLRERDDRVLLSVEDTGIGIDAADLPHVFDRFHRVLGARARTHEGSGIGLALVNDLVKLHGGTVSASSAPDRGTTIDVALPRGLRHLPADQIAPARALSRDRGPNAFVAEALRWLPEATPAAAGAGTPPAVAAPTDVRRGRVLVADDNADMRAYLVRLLAGHWEVVAVGDGDAALEAVRAQRPDLVIADVMMPTCDGFALLARLRADEDTRDIPVVMLSARAGEEARVEGLEAGADDYLVKPFAARELIARVTTQITLARGTRERAELLARERAARREAELQKQHLHALFMQAPVAVAVLKGPDHVVELANPMVCRVWGRQPEQVLGLAILEALPEIRRQPWKDLLEDVYVSGVTRTGTETPAQLDRDGSGVLETVYFDFVYTPLRDIDGVTEGVLVIASDVTAQVLARQEMDALRAGAEEANRAKDEFLAMLGHELRNPLAPILTALQLLKLRGLENVERERALIERQVKHLVGLVDDLLDVSRITRGKIALRPQTIEIAEVVARAIEIASPMFEQQRHELDVQVPRTGLTVHGDPARLAQVVANLLTNAAKYTEPGGRVTVRARGEDAWLVVEVRDTGVGIDPDVLPRIFDMFVQERQSIERATGGLGLGLAIVRSLVTQHGGTVSAESAGPGRGSLFTIRLPRFAGVPQRSAVVDNARPGEGANGRRVLVVDDNHDAALMLGDMLMTFGYTIRCAHDGLAALTIADAFDPDVALVDIGLPVMDGYELARRLSGRARPERVRLVALTGYGQERDRRLSAEAGFDAHLVKPVDAERLRATLDAVLAAPAPRSAT